MQKVKTFLKENTRVLVGISVTCGALTAWAADKIDLLELIQKLKSLF